MFKGKRIFISGGAGVIGSALVKNLYEQGAIIFVGDLKDRPKAWPLDIIYRKGDLNYINSEELHKFSPEFFFHLAASFERSVETYDYWEENNHHNILLSQHLLRCLKECSSLKRIIFASSYLIYDPSLYLFNKPQSMARRLLETDPIYPRNLTGVAKLLHEIEINFFERFDKVNFSSVCARIFRVYGKNSKDVISRWVRSLLSNEQITVYNKEGLFDYIYADDVAEGLVKLAVSDVTGIVNLGNDKARKVEDVLNTLKRYFPDMAIKVEDLEIPYEASQADMTKFKKLINWQPIYNLEDAIPKIIEHEKEEIDEISKEENILVLSSSVKIPLIEAVEKATKKFDGSVKIIGADTNPDCLSKHFVNEFWEMPLLTELSIEEFISGCKEFKVKYVIPTRDGELQYFSKHKERLKKENIYLMISNFDSIHTCFDKQLFYDKLIKLGFPVIKTVASLDKLTERRLVVKERYGAGSVSIGLDVDYENALQISKKLKEPIFQPFIEGTEYSIDVYVDLQGKAKGAIARERTVIKNGESQITTAVNHEQLEEKCKKIAEVLKLYGHVVFQAIIDENDNIHIIECNSRFGGASTLSIEMGLDSFYWFLIEASGENLNSYPFLRSSSNKKLIRYPKDLII